MQIIYLFVLNILKISKAELKKAELEKRVCLMDVDIQGVEKLQKTNINPLCIFIRPRSFAILVSWMLISK